MNSSDNHTVFFAGHPKVSLSSGPTYVEMGKDITLPKCHVKSFPPAVITWSKFNGGLMKSRTVAKDGQLTILQAKMADFGLYECTASNKLGRDSAWTHLNVFQLPRFTKTPPAQLQKQKNKKMSVPCQATGHSKPKITWSKEGGNLPVGRSLVKHDGTLQIWDTKVEDSGTYTCTATSNVIHKAVTTMNLAIGSKSTLYILYSRFIFYNYRSHCDC